MARRIHKKSRNGCLECKRRHFKCDERQPICSNCTTAGLVCEYGNRLLSATRRSPLLEARVHSAPTTPAPGSNHLESPAGYQPVNMLHFELFHNLYTQIRTSLDLDRSIAWLADDCTALEYYAAGSAGILSLSCSPNCKTQALSIFKESSPQVTQETCVPLFVFAVSLGIHTLCDTLIYREGDFANFLDRFVHFFRLYRGIRTIVNESWHMIQDTPLALSFSMGTDLYRFNGHLGPGCQTLLSLINRANLGKELTEIYRQAIESLQSCLNVIEDRSKWHVGINAVTTWPILLRIEFAELIEQRRPEAMVILAHYACMLHLFRNIWLFGDSGAFVIQEVTGYLGPEWEECMAWPNQMLRSSLST